jgi:hypothetical protein
MGMTTRREFVQQTGIAAAAVCARPIEALARTPGTFVAREPNPAPLDAAALQL